MNSWSYAQISERLLHTIPWHICPVNILDTMLGLEVKHVKPINMYTDVHVHGSFQSAILVLLFLLRCCQTDFVWKAVLIVVFTVPYQFCQIFFVARFAYAMRSCISLLSIVWHSSFSWIFERTIYLRNHQFYYSPFFCFTKAQKKTGYMTFILKILNLWFINSATLLFFALFFFCRVYSKTYTYYEKNSWIWTAIYPVSLVLKFPKVKLDMWILS